MQQTGALSILNKNQNNLLCADSNHLVQFFVEIYLIDRLLVKFKSAGKKVGLFRKILNNAEKLPYPGELKNLLKTSLAFSDPNNEYDYLKRIYTSLGKENNGEDLKNIQEKGFTVREIEILTGVSKSQISRKIKEMI
jgi:hypothetical protein